MKRARCRKGVNGPEKGFRSHFPDGIAVLPVLCDLPGEQSMRERRFFHTFANSWESLDNG